ncbi:hypothetical protein [Pseudomonas graminis]|uniref:Uncharacterized protein n=1 Tax=Pseudomonas graminis TaxID=158627 RepID=A0A1C2DRN6_9PSED|nr:hypothetical protein [Pseudomonas graminis]OCX17295.1 hypothetical protein BBI10_17395 [Pseudomonas graminis]
MISFSLNPDAQNRIRSAELAEAVAEFESRGGQILQGECFTGNPIPPKRRDWIDPDTVLKRRTRALSAAERGRLQRRTRVV